MTSVDDGWIYAGMQNTDIGLAPLVVVCSSYRRDRAYDVARPGPTEAIGAEQGHILGLLGRVSPGPAEF